MFDEPLTALRQMFEDWPKETGKLESLGPHRYLPGETISSALLSCIYCMLPMNHSIKTQYIGFVSEKL